MRHASLTSTITTGPHLPQPCTSHPHQVSRDFSDYLSARVGYIHFEAHHLGTVAVLHPCASPHSSFARGCSSTCNTFLLSRELSLLSHSVLDHDVQSQTWIFLFAHSRPPRFSPSGSDKQSFRLLRYDVLENPKVNKSTSSLLERRCV